MRVKTQEIFAIILDFLFPRRCSGCGAWDTWLCEECQGQIVWIRRPVCFVCQRLTPRGQYCSRHKKKASLTGILAVAYFREGPLRALIHNFKYQKWHGLGGVLGQMVADHISDWLPRSGRILVVPIPLHPSRERERGFNQSAILAEILAKTKNWPFDTTHFQRVKTTQPQVEVGGRKAREANFSRSFLWQGPRLNKTTVILIDDVATTGSTLEAAGRALRRAGAMRVWAVALAKD